MANTVRARRPADRLARWLLEERVEQAGGPYEKEGRSRQASWWRIMCLTGVDYFSSLAFAAGIAALAAGALSPVATLFIVLLTLFGALPVYRRVAEASPNGQGSIAMLEKLLSFWKGKLLVLVYTAIAFVVIIIFQADVDAQGGAYATGVLVLMTSAAFAVTLAAWRRGSRRGTLAFALITAAFVYTTALNVYERPDGIRIASFFIAAIVITSLISRVRRSTELRLERVEMDETAKRFIKEAARDDEIHIIANRRQAGDEREYAEKEREQREDNHIPPGEPILILEVEIDDPSEFADVLEVRGVEVGGYRVLHARSASVPNAIAAFLLYLRDTTGRRPHCYFGWTEGNPIAYMIRYLLFGEGDTAPVTREILREAEPDPKKRPAIHVGG